MVRKIPFNVLTECCVEKSKRREILAGVHNVVEATVNITVFFFDRKLLELWEHAAIKIPVVAQSSHFLLHNCSRCSSKLRTLMLFDYMKSNETLSLVHCQVKTVPAAIFTKRMSESHVC